MASRKPAANRKRGATSSRKRPAKPPRRGLPGWLWGLGGLVAGFLISQHQHGTAPWQDGPETAPPPPVAGPDARPPAEDEAAPPAREEPPMPTFEFYTLLPESEVIAPGDQASTATPPPRRDEADAAPAEPSAPADDPIARVIAANSAPVEEAPRTAEADGRYVLQAASFRAPGDARQLAGRLQDFGLLAKISEVQTGDGATWHRVQVGPYSDRRELDRARDLMATQGIEPLLIQLQ
ncbi:SPOR domain-containing protein [Halomonas koreensis]|uniref:SPOR domain-containing protein n=1 Tax=Halomonas koreensis TaxID=245385 RepID=A0ABU1G2Q5_9GAMM|nr:SPOR domain-containing protein [Halomonas koreensis]MDR5867227.1 SPOR domain-containing protein [Halomonas koreensis]